MDSLKDSHQTFSRLLEKLDYASSPNLISEGTPSQSIPADLEVTWREAKDKLGIDAVYFVANAPVIYFKRFEAYEPAKIAEFHRKVWNQSRVPLIFVILPGDIRVYNGYKVPQRTKKKDLTEPSRLDYELSSLPQERSAELWEEPSTQFWERLEVFTRTAIDSGTFWRDHGDHFNRETRADQTLLANLSYIRRQLIEREPKLEPEYAHNLIGRSIFALYLQDRGILPEGEDGFFAREFGGKYSRYTDLLASHEDTYAFFTFLRERFDGDMFPVTDEEKATVRTEHLSTLQRLFTIDSTKGGQMLFFWAYNFAFIPIELISAIYEEFLYQEESGRNGAYYTPPMLVDFMLDQVLPRSEQHYNLRVLDPACGSGIFLVEAYRRLVERWRKAHRDRENPQYEDLIAILKASIFGVDIKLQALRIAAFSLYLAMLDYIEPKTIWMEVQFPPLININLIAADFFEERVTFEDKKFDLVVGNPPWESQLTAHAQTFLDKYGYRVGDKQIAQAFLWHAPDYCHPHSQIALLCSSKSLLFNKSGPNIDFRRTFFRKFTVTKVFDFSALRRFLFPKATGPASAIFYTSQRPTAKTSIFYGAPKPTPLARRFTAIAIETTDLKQLPLWQVLESLDSMKSIDKRGQRTSLKQTTLFDSEKEERGEMQSRSPNIWKVALWGTSYDYILLEILNRYPSLAKVMQEREWYSGSGFIRDTGSAKYQGKEYAELKNALFLDEEDFTLYGIDTNRLKILPENARYQRGRDSRIFKSPLVLFKRGQAQRRPGTAFLNQDCTYTSAITGIAGSKQDTELLKALTALLNSDLAQYFLFLTSTSWGVEREEITAGDLKTIPFPILDADTKHTTALAWLVDELAKLTIDKSTEYELLLSQSLIDQKNQRIQELEQELNKHIYQCFRLSEQEIQHIQETVQYAIGFFNSPENSPALQRPTVESQESFARAYTRSINFYLEPVGKKLIANVYTDETAPLLIVQFSSRRRDEETADIRISHMDERMRRVLLRLDKLGTEPFSKRMYHRRDIRMYDREEDVFYIAKPAEQRHWTIGAALSDVGRTISELIQPVRVSR